MWQFKGLKNSGLAQIHSKFQCYVSLQGIYLEYISKTTEIKAREKPSAITLQGYTKFNSQDDTEV